MAINQRLKLNIALPGQPKKEVAVNGRSPRQAVKFGINSPQVKRQMGICDTLAHSMIKYNLDQSVKLGMELLKLDAMVENKDLVVLIDNSKFITHDKARQCVRIAVFKRQRPAHFNRLRDMCVTKMDVIAQQPGAVQNAMLRQHSHKIPGTNVTKKLEDMERHELYALARKYKKTPRFSKKTTLASLRSSFNGIGVRIEEMERNRDKFETEEIGEIREDLKGYLARVEALG